MNKIFYFAVVMMLSAFAQARAAIGPAGCGLGNMVMGKDSQVLASTTNGTGTQTFGITSGTSNCVDGAGMAKIESYIEANPEALANDISRGQGETLTGLTQLLKCENPQAANQILKSNYSAIYQKGTNDSSFISNEVKSVLSSDVAQHGCQG